MGPMTPLDAPQQRSHPQVSAASVRVGSSAIRELLALAAAPDVLSLAGGLPADELLPGAQVAEVTAALLRGPSAPCALQYGPTQGEPELRRWIAEHELGGVDPARVLVTQGAQQALDLLVDVLVDPGDDVVVEQHSYVGMLQPLARCAAAITDVPADRDGICTLELAAALRRLGATGRTPTLLYLAPTFQNPTGSVLNSARRRQVGRLAEQHRVVVVDDDPYRRLAFTVAPERLRAHVPEQLAVTIGSFSKFVAPGLRVGWVHGPDWLIEPMVRLKQSRDLHTGSLSQRVLIELLSRPGWLGRQIARLRDEYLERAEVLETALREQLGDRVQLDPSRGGMFTWAHFPGLPVSDLRLAELALEHGVAIVPASVFASRPLPNTAARLNFSSLDVARLEVAARRLARAVDRAWHDAAVPTCDVSSADGRS